MASMDFLVNRLDQAFSGDGQCTSTADTEHHLYLRVKTSKTVS